MKWTAIFFGAIFLLFACSPSSTVKRPVKQLLYYSNSINTAPEVSVMPLLAALSAEQHFELDTTGSFANFNEDFLSQYSTIILQGLNPDSLSPLNFTSLERYVQAGNGLILLSPSKATPYSWPWLDSLIAPPNPPFTDATWQGWSHQNGRIVKNLSDNQRPDQTQLKAAIDFAIGTNSYDLSKVTTPLAPDFNRFTRVVLDNDLFEPMELAVLPDLDVLFIERRGKMKRYDAGTKETYVVGEFEVCTSGNYEDGLTGLAIDPDYGKSNHFIYVYYSPSCDDLDQYLSRFVFKDDSLHWASEQVILKVRVQRESCCHSAGSIVFGPDKLLYLSTGDNTISSLSDGFSPIDERPGHYINDAQKSSANTHDLRGKILRIKLEQDGTYSIPDGNLFPKDGSQGRPEIYVMGCRNPFRYTVDRKTNFLYWGEVGPDGSSAGKYGPNAHDEFNQARQPGNFGWPLFTANNLPYNDRNFETGEAGAPFDPAAPLNDSPNNTGNKILPPAQPAMIWYTYGKSELFPSLGAGGRCAMAGPVYYDDENYLGSSTQFPSYYNGKLFIYEWVRNWIKVVSFDKNGDLARIEPFMPNAKVYGPIEMEFGPEGAMYMMEYGNGYFLKNPQAKLVKIEYAAGNRMPIAMLSADQTEGAAPHSVAFSAAKSFDYDQGDSLRYEWSFGGGGKMETSGATMNHTFSEPGVYEVKLRVTDPSGSSAEDQVSVSVGNAPPSIALQCDGNSTFFFPNKTLRYATTIHDIEDEENGGLQMQNAGVSLAYVESNEYVKSILTGASTLPDGSLKYLVGKNLINESDCRTCHLDDKKSAGPAYIDVAKKYSADYVVIPQLVSKVINGGSGVWGDERMSAHPQLSEEEVGEMIRYILSMADAPASLPLAGQINFNEHKKLSGAYFLSTVYQDRGANGIGPVKGRYVQTFRSPKVEMENCDASTGVYNGTFGQNREFQRMSVQRPGFILFKNIDLTSIKAINFWLDPRKGGTLELRLDSPEGKVIGNLNIKGDDQSENWQKLRMALQSSTGIHDLYFTFSAPDSDTQRGGMFDIDWWEVSTE